MTYKPCKDAHRIGRAGEHICAAVLETLGVRCALTPLPGFDLIAYVDGDPLRVQVKTASAPHRSRYGETRRYGFLASKGGKKERLTEQDCDIIAFVALDRRRCRFKRINEVTSIKVNVREDHFDETNVESVTWKTSLEAPKGNEKS